MTNSKKIMVGSTVYGFEDQLSQIVVELEKQGYQVLNSHYGNMKVNPQLSNLQNCLNAVVECDTFIGIVRPFYGTGNIGEVNITFEEIKHAISLGKPCFFWIHRDVVFAKKLLAKIDKLDSENIQLSDRKIFDIRSIDIYDHILKSRGPDSNVKKINEFFRLSELIENTRLDFPKSQKSA